MDESELIKAYQRLHEAVRYYFRYEGIDQEKARQGRINMSEASEDIMYIQTHGEDDFKEWWAK